MPERDSVRYSGLIEAARGGDAESRERLFALCRSYLGFVARSQIETWLRRKVDASDLVQETMLEAYRDFERFEGHSEQRVAGLAAEDPEPQRGRFRPPLSHAPPSGRPAGKSPSKTRTTAVRGAPEPAADQPTPSQEFLRLDTELRVTAALAELSPDYQEVDHAPQPPAAPVQRGRRADGPHSPGGADALDAGDSQVARDNGRAGRAIIARPSRNQMEKGRTGVLERWSNGVMDTTMVRLLLHHSIIPTLQLTFQHSNIPTFHHLIRCTQSALNTRSYTQNVV